MEGSTFECEYELLCFPLRNCGWEIEAGFLQLEFVEQRQPGLAHFAVL